MADRLRKSFNNVENARRKNSWRLKEWYIVGSLVPISEETTDRVL